MALVNLDVVIESAYNVKWILITFVVIQNSLKVSKDRTLLELGVEAAGR